MSPQVARITVTVLEWLTALFLGPPEDREKERERERETSQGVHGGLMARLGEDKWPLERHSVSPVSFL